jgi:glucose-1-phosphate thymidylyltransferase
MMKGIILAGGKGTRLGSCTKAVSKQLLPVYDKPMIYYPLSTLLSFGLEEIMIISSPDALGNYIGLLGEGAEFGCQLFYRQQDSPGGLAQAFLIADEFIKDSPSCLILGDNIFIGKDVHSAYDSSGCYPCSICCTHVSDPTNYGVVTFDETTGKMYSLEEKPVIPRSKYSVPGIYFFNDCVLDHARKLTPSKRGELEITDLIKSYHEIHVTDISNGAWFDCGTPDRLIEASQYVQSIQHRTGKLVGDPHVEAYRNKMIQFLPDGKMKGL